MALFLSAMTDTETARRTFLKLSLGGLAGASLAAPLSALARAKQEPIVITPITDSIALVSGAGSNVVVFVKGRGRGDDRRRPG